jgi:hypothetical protein
MAWRSNYTNHTENISCYVYIVPYFAYEGIVPFSSGSNCDTFEVISDKKQKREDNMC